MDVPETEYVKSVVDDIVCFVCKKELTCGVTEPAIINVEDVGIFVCSKYCEEILIAAGG